MRFALLLTALVSVAQAAQLPLGISLPSVSPDASTFASTDDTSSPISVLSHPAIPAHKLRFTKPPGSLCERSPKARSWSGYLDVDVDALHRHIEGPDYVSAGDNATIEHFYFWAFESRSGNAETDATITWLNGGPGCSSFTGLLMELGPCNAAPHNTSKGPHTEWNPFSWNNNATVLFLDQPVGVGFSYASWKDKSRKDPAPGRIHDAPSAARDAAAFLQLWGMHAKDLYSTKNHKSKGVSSFHISGESYAGRWIPLIAEQLVRDNEEAEAHPERGLDPLPLESVLIGNGITSPRHQFPAYVDYACSNKSGYGTFLTQTQCDDMWAQVPVCVSLVEKCNKPMVNGATHDVLACKSALAYCEAALSDPWMETGRSAYDWAHMGDYEQEAWVAAFLNDPKTHKALGIDKKGAGDKHDGVFVGCSDKVYEAFAKTGDGAKESTWAVRNLLEKGVRVLSYSGKRDFICNHIGNEAWTLDLEWSGAEAFRNAPLLPWQGPDGKDAGVFRNAGKLTFLIADDAGHFVPLDQSANALAMVNKWLHTPGDGTF